jgi:hypothetical protein
MTKPTKRGFWSLVEVSDERLERNLKGLIADGCRTEARIVAHLAEMDARKLSLIRGQSLFEYCQTQLGLSDSQAFYRITAARAARRFPILFDLLERHDIHLTTITLISKYLTEENHLQLLQEVRAKSKRDVLKLLARRFPKPDVPSHIRKLPPQPGAFAAGPTATLEPLSEATYRLQLNCSETLQEKLALAADLMSHSNPELDLAVVVERAIDLLIDKLQKRRFGVGFRAKRQSTSAPAATACADPGEDEPTTATPAENHLGRPKSGGQRRASPAVASPITSNVPAPATNPAPVGSTGRSHIVDDVRPERSHIADDVRPGRSHIAHDVRRQLVQRDGLRCTYRGPDGHRCRARAFLQIHHDQAWVKGGADTADNLRFLCEAHNQLLAEIEFGARVTKRAG